MPVELLADVAVRATIAHGEPIFTYRVPAHLRVLMRPGQLVWVPLQRRRVQGVVVRLYRWGDSSAVDVALDEVAGLEECPDLEAPRDAAAPVLRDLLDVADPEAALTAAQVALARWLSGYYCVSLYEALALMLPPGVAQEAETTWRATAEGLVTELGALPERERAVLYFLRQRGELTERDLRRALRGGDVELRESYAALMERGLVVRGALLSRPRARPRVERLVRLRAPLSQIDDSLVALVRGPRQQAVLAYLRDLRPWGDAVPEDADVDALASVAVPLAVVYAATGATIGTLRALERYGVVEFMTREVRRDPLLGDAVLPDVPPVLTSAQERAWRVLATAIEGRAGEALRDEVSLVSEPGAMRAFLLHGVTGSGKTEVYLRSIGRAMRLGFQVLVLVPEIALTAQLVRRFAARFPGRLAVLHSGLALGERYDEWRRLRRGEAMLAIGSRSAVFAPLPRLGLIIVDEEHESSFKHDGAPRYHARDVARRLAALTGSVLVLGSATPSVESYAQVQAGQLALLELPERVGMTRDAQGLPRSQVLPLPPVRIVDMRHELQQGNRSIFSRVLQQALAAALRRSEQAILFLNRRGAAAFIMCRDCGDVVACPHCSTPLVVHYDDDRASGGAGGGRDAPVGARASLLVCHSCNHRAFVPTHCAACWSSRIKSFGVGTQRVVEEVEALFPDARTLRWDRDSVARKGEHVRMLDRFLGHEADVLVGTQMIAKGLDLPLVSVVGVVAADTGLHLPDFRAGERTFQLLTQVAGRAGRRGAGAQVVLQTYTPDHYALLAAQEHDYTAFFTQEIAFRRQTGYPPLSRLVRFVYAGASDEHSRLAAEQLAQEVRRVAEAVAVGDWGIIGPAPAFFHRQRNRYRWHVILRAVDPEPVLASLRLPPGWVLDVDPVQVL